MSEEHNKLDDKIHGAIQILDKHLSDKTELTSIREFVDSGDSTDRESSQLYDHLHENPGVAANLIGEIETYLENETPTWEEAKEGQGKFPDHTEPDWDVEEANAAKIQPADISDPSDPNTISVESDSVDLIVTSPPYWQKRDYGIEEQVGQEPTPEAYIENLIDTLDYWKEFLRSTGSVFINIGDTYRNKSLQAIPGQFAAAAEEAGWTIRNEIRWVKHNGIPSSARDRLVPRHEVIYHLVLDEHEYFYDLHGYSQLYGNGSNPGDVWRISHDQNTGGHLAPYPSDLVRRAITLSCPPSVCTECGEPRRRDVKRGLTELNMDRPQARRAVEIYEEHDELTEDHIRAIQAVGISDVGKAQEFQVGAGQNDDEVQALASEAKEILGGYFREFTFPEWTTVGWKSCDCENPTWTRGTVFDPFCGSGTTIQAAIDLGYNAFGTDIDTSNIQQDQKISTYE
jgi:DNA modification methylase